MLPSPASVGTALRPDCRRAASSVKPVWRAHTSHTSRWSASEPKLASSANRVLIRPLRRHPAESSQVRVRTFPLLFSATVLGFRCCQHPPPPNNSFKPTPCRGVGHVLYATLAHVRRPDTGRLNSGVRPHGASMSSTTKNLALKAISPKAVHADGLLTSPRSFGVYQLPQTAKNTRLFRFGNYPVRQHELERESLVRAS